MYVTLLYSAVLCCRVCCAVLCCAVLCCAVLCCAVLCCAVLCSAVLCSTLLYSTLLQFLFNYFRATGFSYLICGRTSAHKPSVSVMNASFSRPNNVRHSTLLCSALLCSALLCSTLLQFLFNYFCATGFSYLICGRTSTHKPSVLVTNASFSRPSVEMEYDEYYEREELLEDFEGTFNFEYGVNDKKLFILPD